MRRKVLGILILSAVSVFLGIAAVDPLLASTVGAFELIAMAQNRWDPTWNDGDLGITSIAAVLLLLLLAASGGIGFVVGRMARLPTRRTLWICVLVTFVIAATGAALVTGALFQPFSS